MSTRDDHVPKTNFRAALDEVAHPIRVEINGEVNQRNCRDTARELTAVESKRRAWAGHRGLHPPFAVTRSKVHGG